MNKFAHTRTSHIKISHIFLICLEKLTTIEIVTKKITSTQNYPHGQLRKVPVRVRITEEEVIQALGLVWISKNTKSTVSKTGSVLDGKRS